MRKTLLLLLPIALLALFFIALLPVKHPYVASTPLRVNLPYCPTSFDPRVTTDPTSATLHLMLHEGLTRLNDEGDVELCLAKHYTVSPDKKTYTFHLKKSTFSDGSKLTAFNFERSWKQLIEPSFISRASELMFCLKNAKEIKLGRTTEPLGVKALDPYTLEVTLNEPTPYFLKLLAYPTYFPTHPDLNATVAQGKPPITNGPFKMEAPLSHDKLCLVKNRAFHKASKVDLEHIILDIVPDEMTALYLFNQGQNHWFGGLFMPIPPDSLDSILAKHTLRQKPTTGFTFFCFNNDHPLLRNLNIRKAIHIALDPTSLADIFPVLVHATSTGPTPQTFWNKYDLPPIEIPCEASAKELFDQGLKELELEKESLPPLSMIYFNSDLYKSIAQVFQERLQTKLGLSIKLHTTPITEHFHKLKTKNYDMAITAWVSQFDDPVNYLERFDASSSNKNYSGWEDSQFTHLIKCSYQKESKERALLLHQAESLIIEELPILPLYHFNLTYLQNEQLENVQISPLGLVDFRYAFFKIM